jgi:hypothetical protein
VHAVAIAPDQIGRGETTGSRVTGSPNTGSLNTGNLSTASLSVSNNRRTALSVKVGRHPAAGRVVVDAVADRVVAVAAAGETSGISA